MPRAAPYQCSAQVGDQALRDAHPGFQVQGLDFKHTITAMRLGIEPAYQRTAMQDRQGEVAVAALRLRGVTLEPLIEIE